MIPPTNHQKNNSCTCGCCPHLHTCGGGTPANCTAPTLPKQRRFNNVIHIFQTVVLLSCYTFGYILLLTYLSYLWKYILEMERNCSVNCFYGNIYSFILYYIWCCILFLYFTRIFLERDCRNSKVKGVVSIMIFGHWHRELGMYLDSILFAFLCLFVFSAIVLLLHYLFKMFFDFNKETKNEEKCIDK